MRGISPTTLLLALCLAGAAGACKADKPAEDPRHYTENAKRAYEEGLNAFFDRDWETANTLFAEVKKKYAYSRYARLAELRLADIDYRQEKFAEAISGYKAFAHDYPNDPEVPYARYKAAKALFEESSPSLLLGPLEERDLATVVDAKDALDDFLRDYPAYKRRRELDYMLDVITGVLARHELYVARFYRDLGNFDAAIKRVQACLATYPQSGLEPEALVLLGETYMMMKQRRAARVALSKVVVRYPDSAFVRPAREFLKLLGGPVAVSAEPDPVPQKRPEPRDPEAAGALQPATE